MFTLEVSIQFLEIVTALVGVVTRMCLKNLRDYMFMGCQLYFAPQNLDLVILFLRVPEFQLMSLTLEILRVVIVKMVVS